MEENTRKRQKERENRAELRRRQVRRQKIFLGGGAAGILVLLILVLAVRGMAEGSAEAKEKKAAGAEKKEVVQEPETVSLTVSAAGDCTLGTDEYFYYPTSLPAKYEKEQDPGYFFQKVEPVFSQDDLTIVNMEGTLTQETSRKENEVYAFKGDEEYVQILTEGSVEAANLANNHSYDYGEKSYTDTIQALEDAGISTFGYDRTAIVEIKGVKVGLLGTYELDTHEACEEDMIKNIQSLQEQGAQIIIASFHWGIERANIPNETQVKLAHSAIDHGADLVLGHHPHVLQGIETYKGKKYCLQPGKLLLWGKFLSQRYGFHDLSADIYSGRRRTDGRECDEYYSGEGVFFLGTGDQRLSAGAGGRRYGRSDHFPVRGVFSKHGGTVRTEAAQIRSSLEEDLETGEQTEALEGAAVEEWTYNFRKSLI